MNAVPILLFYANKRKQLKPALTADIKMLSLTTLYICTECSPFLVGIFIVWKKSKVLCSLLDEDMCKYVIGKSNIMLAWTYISVLDISGKHNFKLHCKHIIEIPNQQGSKLLQT